MFDRVGSRIGLTHAGELLLSHTKQLLAAYRQMDFEMNLLTDNFAGELRLGASTTISQYVLPPVLASFIKKFPEIKVSLLNGNSRDIEQALREGKITLGLIEGTAHQSTLHYTPFMRDELVVVAHTGSSLAAYDEISLEQLRTAASDVYKRQMFAFAEPQGQNGGVEESFIRYACQNWR